MKLLYDFSLFLRNLAACMKTNHIYIYATLRRKPGILIPDLYFYTIKIQTTNEPAGSSSTHVAGLKPAGLANEPARQNSKPA